MRYLLITGNETALQEIVKQVRALYGYSDITYVQDGDAYYDVATAAENTDKLKVLHIGLKSELSDEEKKLLDNGF